MKKTSKKVIIYQVLPRLFGNGLLQNKPNGSLEENGCGKMSSFSPLALKEIKNMGFTHIWYTGMIEHATQTDHTNYGIRKDHSAVVKGKAGSPYAIKDYYDIDPDLADNPFNRMAEFEALVDRTHEAGLKMILDFVPNHVAREYYSDSKPNGVLDLGSRDNQNTSFAPNNNFYYIPGQNLSLENIQGNLYSSYQEYPAKATGNDCFTAYPSTYDWYETVKLNYGIDYLSEKRTYFNPIPDTWYKMRDILLFWASKGVDAFRCDMAEMVPVQFWEWAIAQIKAAYPDIVFIAEVYDPAQYRTYIHQGGFDYLYDKVGLYDTLRQIIVGNQPASAITQCWQAVDDIQDRMLNFLENHDEQRIASDFFAGNPQKAIPALTVSALMNKSPFMVYFGQELGERGMDEEGFSGRDGRTSIFDYWSVESIRNWVNRGKFNKLRLTDQQVSIRRDYTFLLKLCNSSKAISQGMFYDLMYVNPKTEFFDPDKQYAFMRYYKGEMLIVVANFDANDKKLHLFIPQHAIDYFGATQSLINNSRFLSPVDGGYLVQDEVCGYSRLILRFKKP